MRWTTTKQEAFAWTTVLAMAIMIVMVAVILSTPGCVGTVQPGPVDPVNPIVVKTSVEVDGEATINSIVIESPIGETVYTYPLRAWGQGIAYIQAPRKPYVRFEGDGGWEILPINPQQAEWAKEAIRRGEIVASSGVLSVRSHR